MISALAPPPDTGFLVIWSRTPFPVFTWSDMVLASHPTRRVTSDLQRKGAPCISGRNRRSWWLRKSVYQGYGEWCEVLNDSVVQHPNDSGENILISRCGTSFSSNLFKSLINRAFGVNKVMIFITALYMRCDRNYDRL